MASVDRQQLRGSTLCELYQRTAAIQPDVIALRTVSGSFQITWGEYASRVQRVASGLAALGVVPAATVALMMGNRPEFAIVDTAALHLGAVPFSIYATSSAEQIAHLLNHAESRVVFCEHRFIEAVRAAGGHDRTIVVIDGHSADAITLTELEQSGSVDFDFERCWKAIRPADVATLIYTSGTTGAPKGVELTHANLIHQIGALSHCFDVGPGDRFLSFLPPAHIADRLASHYLQMAHGTCVTFLDDSKNLAAALLDCRPTYWFAVPRVWEKLKVAYEQGFAQLPRHRHWLLTQARRLGHKKAIANQGGPALGRFERVADAVLDRAVLAKVRAKSGLDDLRWAISGGAPVDMDTLNFFLALGVTVCEIWGMSETGGAGLVNRPEAIRPGTVGQPLPGVEIRMRDDGELLIRGAIVASRYRNDPERTAEVFDDEGWFATGDVVSMDADCYVRLIDRKKEIIINAAGKNMSPANIEMAIKSCCPLVGEAVAIGDAKPFNTALIVLNRDVVAVRAADSGLDDISAPTMAASPAVLGEVAAGIAAANVKLSRVEQIKRFLIVPTYWEPGGAELTATLKLRRRAIAEMHASEIAALYAEPPRPGVHDVGENALVGGR